VHHVKQNSAATRHVCMRRTTATQSLTQRVMNASLPRRHAQVRSSSDARRDDIITCRLAVSVRVGLLPYTTVTNDGLYSIDVWFLPVAPRCVTDLNCCYPVLRIYRNAARIALPDPRAQ